MPKCGDQVYNKIPHFNKFFDFFFQERDTACCIRKDRSGCVQSPKSECSKINDPNGEGGPPRSKWVSVFTMEDIIFMCSHLKS